MSNILVIGASGKVGTELVRLLAEAGHEVRRATSRAPTEPGQVQLDLFHRTGLDAAFNGVDRAFLLSPPGHTRQHELLIPAIDQARTSGLNKLVLMTAMGANADEAAPMRLAERHLEASGLAYNIIRPNWFMQNFNSFWLQGIQEHSKILLPVGQARGSFIDARDIAAVAASLLGRDDLANQAFDLTGTDVLDHAQVASILSQVAGRTITYEEISPEAMQAGLVGAAVPADYAAFLVMILGYFKAGYSERSTDAVQTITGRPPIRFAQYAQDHRSAWRR